MSLAMVSALVCLHSEFSPNRADLKSEGPLPSCLLSAPKAVSGS